MESTDQAKNGSQNEEASAIFSSMEMEDNENEQEGLLSSATFSSKHEKVIWEGRRRRQVVASLSFESNDEDMPSIQNFRRKIALLGLCFVATLLVVSASTSHHRQRVRWDASDSETKAPASGSDDKGGNDNHSRSDDQSSSKIKYYTYAKTDRAGAQILDMLMMDSFLYYEGGVFGGVCPKFKTAKAQKQFDVHLESKLELINLLGLEDIFHFDCPTQEELDSGKAKFLLTREYHHFNETFSMEWVHHLRAMTSFQYTERQPGDPQKIVVHMRRGDYSPCRNGHGQKYLPNQFYLDVLDLYLPRYCPDMKDCNLTIYSEELSFENFTAFEKRNYHVDIDASLEQIWTDFMNADLLILSKSSFSWVPAIMNQHHVVTPQYKYPVCDNWEVASEEITAKSDKIADDFLHNCERKRGLRRWFF